MRPAPRHILAASALLAVLAAATALWLALRLPMLGVEFAAAADGALQVQSVDADSPNRALLKPGSRVELTDASLPAADLLIPEPDELDSWERLDALIAAMTRLAGAQTVSARVDGEPVTLSTRPRRLDDLPLAFWMHLLIGGINFVLAVGVLAYRPADPAARHYALFGTGVRLTPYTAAIYNNRELIVDGELLHALSTANHLLMCLTVAALLAMMLTYPRRLGAHLPALAYAAGALAWLGQITRLFPAPNTAYLIVLIFFALSLGLAYPQWRRTRGRPVERAALRWYLLSLLLGTGLFVALVALPLAFGVPPPIDQNWLMPLFLLVPAGIALSIMRYKLFELDRWWRSIWTWFFGGVAVMALDLALLTVFDLTRLGAIALSLALLGWLYFPLRQWLWARWLGGPPAADRHAWLRELSAAANPAELRARWLAALRARYAPLESRQGHGTESAEAGSEIRQSGARIDDDGQTLRVPDPLSSQILLLRHADGGAVLDARQHTNLARIVTDQGAANDTPADWRSGGGTRQISQRAQELGGEAAWQSVVGGTRLQVSIPVERHARSGA